MRKFNRLIAVVLSLCMAFAVVADSAVTVFADEPAMTILVTHWHINNTTSYESTNYSFSLSTPDDKPWEISPSPLEGIESFSGYAVSAGQNAVTFDADNKLHVKYRPDTRLVKIEVFYSAEPQKVLGLDFTGKDLLTDKDAGTTDKDVAWLNPAASDSYVFEPQPDSAKIYNTSLGLHTDKTVTALNDAGEGTREFEVKLESWYAEKSYAEVGMVLDASGSMAFASEGVEPITVDDYAKAGITPNTYLTLKQVNGILTKENTDNSKLGYSDYTYYVYDARSTTKEFVPLGYWDGNLGNSVDDGLIAHYTFDNSSNRLENSVSKSSVEAKGISHVSAGNDYDIKSKNESINVTSQDYYDTSSGTTKRAFDLSRTAGESSAALVIDPNLLDDEFTVAFAIKLAKSGRPNGSESILTIGANGNSDIGYNLVRTTSNNICFGNYSSGGAENTITSVGTDYKFITLVFHKDGADVYIDGKSPNSYALNALSTKKIIFGGYYNTASYNKDSKMVIDEVFVYDRALGAEDVENLYKAVEKPDDAIYLAKYSADGEVIAEAPDGNNLCGNTAAGWYYVNSSSEWDKITNEKLQSPKQFKQLRTGEVVKNYINYDSLPAGVITESEVTLGNTEAYIYTGSKDFKLDSDTLDEVKEKLYYYDLSKNVVGTDTAEKWTTPITEANVALTGADDRQFDENGGSPVVFFVDNAGYLRCFFNNGDNTKDSSKDPRTMCSYVYRKIDDNDIKYESLQYAIGSFVSELHAASPRSRVSAVRFSTKNINDSNQLVLLDWTNNAENSVKMLSLATGDGTVSGSVPSNPPKPEDGGAKLEPLNQYNYVMTGGTYLYTGLQAYESILDPRTEKVGKYGITSKKYVIVFTDGKDNELNNDADPEKTQAKTIAERLKENGYTIYVVLFTTRGFELDDNVKKLMSFVAGNKETTTEGKNYDNLKDHYIFEASNAESLMEAFTGEILGEISSSQRNYAVQDYIDPRFDIEADGTLYKLGPGGNVTYGTESATTTTDISASSLTIAGIKDKDGIPAALYYDDSAKAYYLKWNGVVIPGCTVGDESIAVWSSSFKIVAKEDFIGGNVVLTNGIAENMNYVYSTEETDNNSGVDHSILGEGKPYEHTSKGFPRTTVNVKLLEPELTAGESIIYLGEEIDPTEIINSIKGSDDYDYYWEYLDRYDSKHIPDTSYNTLIENGTLELPYSYLEKDGVLAGTDSHQAETFGTITYELKATDSDDASLEKKDSYKATDLKTKTYTLSVKFDAEDLPADNSREKQIETLVTDEKFTWDGTFKPTAGTEQTTKENTAEHTIETVRGEIVLGLKINLTAEQLDYLKENYPDDYTYNADVFRGETKVGTLSLSFGFGAGYDWTEPVEGQKQLTVYATSNDFTPEDGFAEKLQKGTYSVRPASDVDALKETLLMLEFSDIAAEDITVDNIGQFETSNDTTKAAPKESKIGAIMLPIAKTDSYAEFKLGTAEYAEPAATRKYTDDRLGLCMITVSMPGDDLGTSSLVVTKKITGTEEPDTAKEFNFTLKIVTPTVFEGTLTCEYDVVENVEGIALIDFPASGTLELGTDGLYHFSLKHNQKITINGIPVGSTYIVAEEDYSSEGYATTYANVSGKITVDGAKADVINALGTGKLTVEKSVTGDDVTAEDLVKQFSFTAAFYIDGTPITDPLSYTKDGVEHEFTNGGSFTLANGESVTITGIPDGSTFEITETQEEGFEPAIMNPADGKGEITAEAADVTVTVENRKASNGSPQLPPIQPQPQLGALVVKKTVAAGGEVDRQFTFTFTFTDQTGAQLAGPFEYVKSDGTVGSVANGGQIMLRSGESVSFGGLPEGTRYSVKETGNEGYVTNYALNDNTAVGVITTDTANVEFINTPYVAPDTPGPQQPGDRPPLIPEAPKYGSLSIEKIVFESDTDDSFDFVISLKTPLGASVSGTFPYVGSSRGYVFDGCTVSLRGGEKIVISGIPQGTVYTVTEITPENYISISENSTGMIPADFTSKVVYTNIKSVPTEQAQSSADDAPEAQNPSTGIGFGALLGFISSVFAAITRRRPRSSKN